MKKRWAGILGCIFLCIIFSLSVYAAERLRNPNNLNNSEKKENSEKSENSEIRVTFFNVGKGDAILIETAGHQMLIDTGYDKTAGIILNYLEKRDIHRIDYLVLTHFGKDHVGGADSILTSTEIGEIFQPDYESENDQYLEYAAAMLRLGIQPHFVTETIRFSLDGADGI